MHTLHSDLWLKLPFLFSGLAPLSWKQKTVLSFHWDKSLGWFSGNIFDIIFAKHILEFNYYLSSRIYFWCLLQPIFVFILSLMWDIVTNACTHTFVTKKSNGSVHSENHWSTQGKKQNIVFCTPCIKAPCSRITQLCDWCMNWMCALLKNSLLFQEFSVVSSKYIANFREEKAFAQSHAFNRWFNTGRRLNKYTVFWLIDLFASIYVLLLVCLVSLCMCLSRQPAIMWSGCSVSMLTTSWLITTKREYKFHHENEVIGLNRFLLTTTCNFHHKLPSAIVKPVQHLNWVHMLNL